MRKQLRAEIKKRFPHVTKQMEDMLLQVAVEDYEKAKREGTI